MALGSTQPLTEMSTINLIGGKKRQRLGLTTLPPYKRRMSENVGTSTPRNPEGFHGQYRDSFTILSYQIDARVHGRACTHAHTYVYFHSAVAVIRHNCDD
jgi:hypothetical protein